MKIIKYAKKILESVTFKTRFTASISIIINVININNIIILENIVNIYVTSLKYLKKKNNYPLIIN